MGIMEFMSEPISNAYRQLSQNRSYYFRPNNFHLNSTIFAMEPFIKDVDKIRGRGSKMYLLVTDNYYWTKGGGGNKIAQIL